MHEMHLNTCYYYSGMTVSVVVGLLNTLMVTLAGLVLYAYYEDCDPIFDPTLPDIEKADQVRL